MPWRMGPTFRRYSRYASCGRWRLCMSPCILSGGFPKLPCRVVPSIYFHLWLMFRRKFMIPVCDPNFDSPCTLGYLSSTFTHSMKGWRLGRSILSSVLCCWYHWRLGPVSLIFQHLDKDCSKKCREKSKTYESSLHANKPVGGQNDCAEDLSCKGICDVRIGYLIPKGMIFWWDQAPTFNAKVTATNSRVLSSRHLFGVLVRNDFDITYTLLWKTNNVDISVSVVLVGFLISVFGSPESWSDIATNIYSLAAWPVSIGTSM